MTNRIITNLCRSAIFFLVIMYISLDLNAQVPINDSPCINSANPPFDLTEGSAHNGTTCEALGPNDPGSLPGGVADWENQLPCNNTTEGASVWYMFTPDSTDVGYDIIVSSASISNNMAVQVYNTTNPSSLCNAVPTDNAVIASSCSDLNVELRVPVCDPSLTYFIKVTTLADDCGSFDILVTPAIVCDYANTCEEAIDSLLTITQASCAEPLEYITIPGCLDLACPSDSSTCMADQGPTVWFKIIIDDPAATALITQVEAEGFDVVWSVFQGTSCADMIPIANQEVIDGVTQTFPCSDSDGDNENLFVTPIDPNTIADSIVYWVAVTAIGEISDPNFDFSYNSALTCLACSGESPIDCNNGDFTASIMEDGEWTEVDDDYQFCQGMDVQVCFDFNYDTTGSGNDWLHGVVPVFGPGWDVDDTYLASIAPINNFEFFSSADTCGAFLNGYDLPNVCTYMEDGVLKLCNTACDASCPCTGGMENGDPLPSGFWYNSPGGTVSCDTLGCSPASYWGWPNGTNVDFNMCLELKTKQFDSVEECADSRSLKIIVQTFSDAVTGCWNDANPCVVDPSIQGPSWEIACNIATSVTGNDAEICSNESLNILVQTTDGSASEIQVDVIDNPNVTGEKSYSFTGNSGFIQDKLTNSTDTTQVVSYIIYAIDPTLPCESIMDTLEVTVFSEELCSVPCIPDTINVCRLDSGIDSLCINFNALAAGANGTWIQGDFIPGFDFSDFTLDSVCFEGIQTGCFPFIFFIDIDEQTPCMDTATMMVCVHACPCPSPATQAIPDLCNLGAYNLEDSELSLDSGTWSITSSPVGQNTDGIITDKIFMATGIIPGVYVVRFTIDNPGGGVCDIFSEQTITVIAQEQISVEEIGQLCNVENQEFPTSLDLYSLISVDPSHGGSWTQTGTETMLPITDGSIISSLGVTDFTQTFTFEYLSPNSGGPCPPTLTEVTVVIFNCICPSIELSDPAPIYNDLGALDMCTLIGVSDPGTFTAFNQDGDDVSVNIDDTGCIFDATGIEPGFYSIVYSLDLQVTGNCVQADTVFLEVLQFVSTSSVKKKNIQIYPNPTFNKLYIKSDYTISSLDLYTTTGKSIYQTHYPNVNNVEIDMSAYSSGLYLLQIETENGRWIEKVVRR